MCKFYKSYSSSPKREEKCKVTKFKFVKFRSGICCHTKKGYDEKRPLAKNKPISEN